MSRSTTCLALYETPEVRLVTDRSTRFLKEGAAAIKGVTDAARVTSEAKGTMVQCLRMQGAWLEKDEDAKQGFYTADGHYNPVAVAMRNGRVEC